MLSLLGIVVFIVAMLASIAAHELGHMIPAKKFGVKVTQYMVGFGPTVWSKKRGETEYGIKAIPAGGYIRMVGMFAPQPGAKTEGLAANARAESEEEIVTEDDRRRAFYNLSSWKKIVVMFCGPFTNLLIAAALFAIMLVGFGLPQPSTTISSVSECVPSAAGTQCGPDGVKSPAHLAGVKPGDVLVSLGGHSIDSWETFDNTIGGLPSGPTTLVVKRGGEEKTLPVTLVSATRAETKNGQPTGKTLQRTFLGIGPKLELSPQPVSSVPTQLWNMTTASAKAMATFPGKLVGVSKAAFGDEKRDPNGPVGVVGVGRISGDVVNSEIPADWKTAQLIGLVASVNLFLFLFNLIPLLPLDGGHIAGAIWEGLRRTLAKWAHKPDPGHVDVARALPLAYVASFLLIGVSVLLLYADIVNPIKLG